MSLKFIQANGFKIAYDFRKPITSQENRPIVVYFGGLMSSMQGTKATLLDKWAAEHGFGYLRFDYRGHGDSSGEFIDFGPSDWVEDAVQVIKMLAQDRVIIVGSSLGGWIGAAVAKVIPEKIAGYIGVAAAPDFVERDFIPKLGEEALARLKHGEIVELPSDYPEPYYVGNALIEGGKKVAVLDSELVMRFPVRLLHGLEDTVVEPKLAIEFAQHIVGNDVEIRLVKGEDHGFSSARGMKILINEITKLLKNSL